MGEPGIGICQSSGKGRKTTQYAPSTVKDLTSARTQNVLSSSNMAKPITWSSSRNLCSLCCSKYMEFLPDLPEVRVYYVDIHILAKRNPNLKPSEVVRQSILEGLKTDVVNWHELEKTTDSLLDTNIKFQIWKLKSASNPAGRSFEVVAHLKQKSRREVKMSFMSTKWMIDI